MDNLYAIKMKNVFFYDVLYVLLLKLCVMFFSCTLLLIVFVNS